jgi:hypothetical protein
MKNGKEEADSPPPAVKKKCCAGVAQHWKKEK